MNAKKYMLPALCMLLLVSGCGAYKTVDKDIPIEEMDSLGEKYVGRTAWTRALIVDIKQTGIIDRGTEVEIVELDLHWGTAVGVKGPNKRKYRHALNLDRPVTSEAFDEAMDRLFWYDKPEKRYRMGLRKYGKRTARAIRDNELFKGMPIEAAIESIPTVAHAVVVGIDDQEWGQIVVAVVEAESGAVAVDPRDKGDGVRLQSAQNRIFEAEADLNPVALTIENAGCEGVFGYGIAPCRKVTGLEIVGENAGFHA